MTIPVLFCRDPLTPRKVDEHFAAEADAVRAAGGTVALIDHDALLAGETARAIRGVPADLGPAWYRGWMIPAGRYAELAAALPTGLVTGPADYRRAHELPGWYSTFETVTPASAWTPTEPGRVPDLTALVPAGRAIVKDYVKSRKHDWDTACHVPTPADLPAVVAAFVALQEEYLAGGIVVRAFEEFDPGEARVWWLDGEPILVGPHPDTPGERPEPDLAGIGALVRALGCRFVTTDLARRCDGVWRVVEVGDGQVSDLPRGVDPAAILTPLIMAKTGEQAILPG